MANVPNVPGVPALESYAIEAIALLTADAIGLITTGANTWDIQLNGASIFDFDSFSSLSFRKEWVVATYPIEGGSFMSYDKVEMPGQLHVIITSGGTPESRESLLAMLDQEAATTDLFDIITPDKVYSSYTIAQVDYDRSAVHGLGMLVIDVVFDEIRSSSPVAFQNTQNPTDQGQQGGGNVQPQAPTNKFDAAFAAFGGAQ